MQIRKSWYYVFELFVISLNFFLAYYVASNFESLYPFDLFPDKRVVKGPVIFDQYLPVYWLVLSLWALILWLRGGYGNLRIQSPVSILGHMLLSGLLFFALFSSAAFILRMGYTSRFFMIYYSISTTLLLTAIRVLVLFLARKAWRQGHNLKHILLVGTGRRAQQFMSHVAKHPEWGYHIIGLLDHDSDLKGTNIAGYRVLGTLEDIPEILENRVVDEVIFVAPRSWLDRIGECILYCEAVGVPATLATDLFDLEIASGTQRKLEGIPYLTFQTRLLKEGELFIKRAFDIAASLSVLLLAGPVLILIAVLIKTSSPGPVFFKQTRSGRNGRKFHLYKFRSMVVNAEAQMAALRARNEMDGPVFKLSDDPRITPVGKILRATSLDEFPQFWNVLRGDMSVVGPRPPLPSEVEEYEPWQRRRLSMKPGITCIWQVSGRNEIGFEEWMEMDLRYIDNWSLFLDLKLLLLTVRAVFARTGK